MEVSEFVKSDVGSSFEEMIENDVLVGLEYVTVT